MALDSGTLRFGFGGVVAAGTLRLAQWVDRAWPTTPTAELTQRRVMSGSTDTSRL